MAIGRTNAGGAGGAALNFKVVPGLTQPGTASENTIWVKTESLTGWYFAATQPENMQEGEVWFPTGTESAVEFNALKKNAVQVYPLSATQMVDGALVDVEAMSYQEGEWVIWWDGQLYELGNEFTQNTGGLEFSVGRPSGYTLASGTKGSDSITLDCSVRNTAIQAITANKIDLTKYRTLKCNVKSFSNWARLLISSTKEHDGDGEAFTEITGEGISSLDISGFSGSYYVCVYTHYAYNGVATKVEFDKLRLCEV